MKSTFWVLFVPLISSVPLKPGEPGGPWTEEEIGIVRDKVNVVLCILILIILMSYFVTNSYDNVIVF